MEITCNMAIDLADLYISGATSDDSNRAVEAHLAGCPKCREFYKKCEKLFGNSFDESKVNNTPDCIPPSKISEEKLTENVRLLSQRLRKKRRLTHFANAAFIGVGIAMLTAGLAFLLNSGDKSGGSGLKNF